MGSLALLCNFNGFTLFYLNVNVITFPVFITPIVWDMIVRKPSLPIDIFQRATQDYYLRTTQRAEAAVVSTITTAPPSKVIWISHKIT